MNIFLIGFMGSGKSTIGRLLATKQGINFIDVDQVIEEKYKKSIGEIFAIEGETRFREIEHNTLQNNLDNNISSVVSVGGGLPCFHENMDLMNSKGITVYLKMSAEAIYSRLVALSEQSRALRPLIANKSNEELKVYISETLIKREPFYNQAKLVISNENSDVSLCVSRIKQAISYF